MRGVLRLPDFRLLFTGLAASMAGDALMVLVYGIWVKSLRGGAGHAVQRRSPGPLVGRVSLAVETLTGGPQTVSIAVGALLVSVVDYRLMLLAVLAGMLAAAAYLWRGRSLTSPLPRTPVPEETAIPPG